MIKERSHDFCQTRPLTRRVVFSIFTSTWTPEDAKSVFVLYVMGTREQENRKRKAAKSCQSLDTWVSKVPRQEPLDADNVHQCWSVIMLWDLVATPTEAGARDYSEGLVPQYFDVSVYILKLLLYNLIQTVVFEKCNIQFLPCTLPLQFLMYCYFPK